MSGGSKAKDGRVYVYGCSILPGSGGDFAGEQFYTCPIANASQPWTADIVGTWSACKVDGITLPSLAESPSRALIQALTCADRVAADVRSLRSQMDADDMRLGAAAMQHQRQWR